MKWLQVLKDTFPELSSSTWRTWIEIRLAMKPNEIEAVVLHMEDVD